MLTHTEGQKLSNRARTTKVHAFPGASSDDTVCWNSYRNPDSIIVHAGMNDVNEPTTKKILENYLDIMATIKEINPEIRIVFSSVIQRHDAFHCNPEYMT